MGWKTRLKFRRKTHYELQLQTMKRKEQKEKETFIKIKGLEWEPENFSTYFIAII